VLREDAADVADTAAGTREAVASRQPQPGLAQLAELVDAAREASVAGTRLIISGPVAPLDPGVELAAYRIVQEALTNARRHAPGAAADVELRYGDGTLRLRVRDNGPGPVAALSGSDHPGPGAAPDGAGSPVAEGRPAGSGHGLLGMRERAFSVGGSLYTGMAPGGGFLVEAVLPAEPDPVRQARAAVSAEAGVSVEAGAAMEAGR
jgi:signal transduction histidine kinase